MLLFGSEQVLVGYSQRLTHTRPEDANWGEPLVSA